LPHFAALQLAGSGWIELFCIASEPCSPSAGAAAPSAESASSATLLEPARLGAFATGRYRNLFAELGLVATNAVAALAASDPRAKQLRRGALCGGAADGQVALL
jgi:hypothetical protein